MTEECYEGHGKTRNYQISEPVHCLRLAREMASNGQPWAG